MLPVLQGFVGVQPPPWLQGLQAPFKQTPPGQVVPFVRFPDSLHWPEPLEQSTLPVLQGFVGLHPEPWLHGLQLPLRHTPPGHTVPFTRLPESVHTATPVPHSTDPVLQGLVGVQPEPWLQALQVPPLQTPPMHVVPLVFGVSSTHCEEPEAHEVMPFRHAEPGFVVQAWPATQGLHEPLRQAPPEHAVPFGLLPESTHSCMPEAHERMPVRQAAFGFVVQVPPPVQGLQVPLRHTPPVQAVPLVFGLPSWQTAAPLLQSTVPLRHAAFGFEGHEAPCVQDTHWSEALQTWLVPHDAPVPLRLPLVQTGLPEVHEMEPLKHGFAGGQVAPAVQFTHIAAALQT